MNCTDDDDDDDDEEEEEDDDDDDDEEEEEDDDDDEEEEDDDDDEEEEDDDDDSPLHFGVTTPRITSPNPSKKRTVFSPSFTFSTLHENCKGTFPRTRDSKRYLPATCSHELRSERSSLENCNS